MFNLFAKNLAAECNSLIHENRKRTSKDSKDDDEPTEKRDKTLMKAKKLQSN